MRISVWRCFPTAERFHHISNRTGTHSIWFHRLEPVPSQFHVLQRCGNDDAPPTPPPPPSTPLSRFKHAHHHFIYTDLYPNHCQRRNQDNHVIIFYVSVISLKFEKRRLATLYYILCGILHGNQVLFHCTISNKNCKVVPFKNRDKSVGHVVNVLQLFGKFYMQKMSIWWNYKYIWINYIFLFLKYVTTKTRLSCSKSITFGRGGVLFSSSKKKHYFIIWQTTMTTHWHFYTQSDSTVIINLSFSIVQHINY